MGDTGIYTDLAQARADIACVQSFNPAPPTQHNFGSPTLPGLTEAQKHSRRPRCWKKSASANGSLSLISRGQQQRVAIA